MDMFELYVQHVNHGPADLPAKLDYWVFCQRGMYLDGKLEPYRVELLESTSNWQWMPFEAHWAAMYDRLTAYVEEYGNAAVPKSYARDQELAIWYKTQKQSFRDGILRPDRIELLSLLDPFIFIFYV